MEALISVTVAALAVIDMAKGVDRSALAPGPSPGRLPPPGHAHKDSDLRNTRRTQRLDPALVCGPVFPNSLPCVRHQEERVLGTDRSGGGPAEKGTAGFRRTRGENSGPLPASL